MTTEQEPTIELDIPDKHDFTDMIEKLVVHEGLDYISAILQVCEERQLDPRDVGKLIVPTIRRKVEAEAQLRNMLPKTDSLQSFLS